MMYIAWAFDSSEISRGWSSVSFVPKGGAREVQNLKRHQSIAYLKNYNFIIIVVVVLLKLEKTSKEWHPKLPNQFKRQIIGLVSSCHLQNAGGYHFNMKRDAMGGFAHT